MKRVLVTGAYGFIGRHCLPHLLAAGFDIHAVSSRIRRPCAGVKGHQADLLAPGEVAALLGRVRPSHLLHLAWYAVPGRYWTAPENVLWLKASTDLLSAFAAGGGTRIVMAGTCAEYDWSFGWCSETVTPLVPVTPYGKSKHALCSALTEFSGHSDLSSAWGRIFFLYGPHEHPARLVASVIRSLVLKKPAECSTGEQVRDFLHVSDVASAFVALLDSEVCGPINIGSGKPVSVKDVVSKIGVKLGREDLLCFGARPTPSDEPPLLVADTRRLAGEVGWSAEYDIESGLDATISWWQGNLRSVRA